MVDLSNYYQREPAKDESTASERFPRNHVKFSPLLKPVQWIDSAYRLLGKRAFMLKKEMQAEFDRSIPFHKYLGTEQELAQTKRQMEIMCDGIDNNPFLSPNGRFLFKKITLGMLQNRKKVLKFYDSNKSFIDKNGSFKAPLIVTGAGRTGTTLLQRLLSEDPNTRSPYTFELEVPIPPMKKDTNPLEDPRIKTSDVGIGTLIKLAPGFVEKFAESHFWAATEMDESMIYMYSHNGSIQMNYASAGKECILGQLQLDDFRSVYRYEKLFFTMLDAYRPAKSHWTLKAPIYSTTFPLIFEEYENARVVLTHRNPLITVPSISRLYESWCIAYDHDGTFDKHRFGQLVNTFHKICHDVPLNYRKSHPESEDQIIDCMYDEFFADPIGMVKSIYEKFDLDYTRLFEDRMKVYLENNQQGKYGRHSYSLEEYGFDAESLYEEYREYMNHYGYGIPEKFVRPESFDFLKNYKN